MIIINADSLSDGLYQIQNGQIHKYKAKGGTVRTYEMGEIVRCKDCKHKVVTEDGEYEPDDIVCEYWMSDGLDSNDYCSYGDRKE